MGAPPQLPKSFSPARNRRYLGTSVLVGDFIAEGFIRLQPKSSTRHKVLHRLFEAIQSWTLARDEAGKLWGDLNWLFNMCAGHAGRVAGPVLTAYQHSESSQLSDHHDWNTLKLLEVMVATAGPHDVQVHSTPAKPMLIYSDATFEDGTLRLGWVLLWRDIKPQVVTRLVPPSALSTTGRPVRSRFIRVKLCAVFWSPGSTTPASVRSMSSGSLTTRRR